MHIVVFHDRVLLLMSDSSNTHLESFIALSTNNDNPILPFTHPFSKNTIFHHQMLPRQYCYHSRLQPMAFL